MSKNNYKIGIKASPITGSHDAAAVIFQNDRIEFGIEEERLTREKHSYKTFPKNGIKACLDHCDIELEDVDKVLIGYDVDLLYSEQSDISTVLEEMHGQWNNNSHPIPKIYNPIRTAALEGWNHIKNTVDNHLITESHKYDNPLMRKIENRLNEIGEPVPPIESRVHHKCHAASAYHPTDFTEAIILTIDGRGEKDATVVWHAKNNELLRIKTYEVPNSLGRFYGIITEYLGYRRTNGEGKVMGLAPYGERNEMIEKKLKNEMDFGKDYDVRALFHGGVDYLESLFDRPAKKSNNEFDKFHKDLAYTAQKLLEQTVTEITEYYCNKLSVSNVGLAGGVALNCKMNKKIRELKCVNDLYIQPVAHDAGLSIGAGYLETNPHEIEPLDHIYWGPSSEDKTVEEALEKINIEYRKLENKNQYIAESLAEADLVGWFQGRMEMGPRALGNRSILADPRTDESRDRVNEYVKHREEWRPFAPSILEDYKERYLVDSCSAPFMIQTFETTPEAHEKIPATLHPADKTTRPQTVSQDANPEYYDLINEFRKITSVPAVLNTSFNDHGEPIVCNPTEAIKDFYAMGLDMLVIGEYIIEK